MFMFCYGHPLAVQRIKLHMCGLIFQQSLTMPMLCHARAIDIGMMHMMPHLQLCGALGMSGQELQSMGFAIWVFPWR